MKPILFATIGSNNIVQSFLRGAFHHPRFCLQAIYSRTPNRASEFADICRSIYPGLDERCPKPLRFYDSLEALAADKEIDAVYIASPNSCHCAQTIMMLESGKHVICEKPLAANAAECRMMMEAANRSRRPDGTPVLLMEAMKTTLLPGFAQLQKYLPEIGTVRRYFAQFCQYSSRYDLLKAGTISNVFDPRLAGGSMIDIGIYGIAPLVHLFGSPKSIYATATLLSSGVDGQGCLQMEYPEMEATVLHSKISDSALPSEIQGEDGRLQVSKLSNMANPILLRRLQSARKPGSPVGGLESVVEDISVPVMADDMFYEVEHFISLIESGLSQSPQNTLDRSLCVLEIMDEARRQTGIRQY